MIQIIHHCFRLHHHHHQKKRVQSFLAPSILSSPCYLSHFLSVRFSTLATEVSIHDIGVRSPLNGRTMASLVALLTTSWYFLIFKSRPIIRFKFVGAENYNRLHCTTHGTSILKSSTMLQMSSSCWIIVLDDTHS